MLKPHWEIQSKTATFCIFTAPDNNKLTIFFISASDLGYLIDALIDRLELLLLRVKPSARGQSPEHVDDAHVDLVCHGRRLADLWYKINYEVGLDRPFWPRPSTNEVAALVPNIKLDHFGPNKNVFNLTKTIQLNVLDQYEHLVGMAHHSICTFSWVY